MSEIPPPLGRRERNKQAKLERIVAAAGELFAEFGVDDVTTSQIAEKADIGAGTLFLYAKSKGELLLMVQNSSYANSLVRGRAAAEPETNTLDAIMAILSEVVRCNRTQVENGRTYLREVIFGDPAEPNRGEALNLSSQTEESIATILQRAHHLDAEEAATRAHIISAIMFLAMSTTSNASKSVDELLLEIGAQVRVLLPQE